MNNEEMKKPKYRNVFIVPVFGIAFFVILTMTFSFAYYSTGTNIVNYTEWNVVYPQKCSLSITNAQVSLTINKGLMFNTVNNVTASGSAYVYLNGTNECQCNYTVKLFQDSGPAYVASGNNEFSYSIAGTVSDTTSPNTIPGMLMGSSFPPSCQSGSIDSSSGCTLMTDRVIGVVTDGTQVYHKFDFGLTFRYLPDANQSSHIGTTRKYSLRITTTSCT